MKNTSSIAITALLVLLAFISVGYLACRKPVYVYDDPCMKIYCYNGGTCADGTCICATGYIGRNCEEGNPCDTMVCQNGGSCAYGKCNCPDGYEGSRCEEDSRTKFLGLYKGRLACSGTPTYPNLVVLPGSSLRALLLQMDSSLLKAEFIGPQTFNITEGNLGNIPVTGTGYFDKTAVHLFISWNSAVQCIYDGKR